MIDVFELIAQIKDLHCGDPCRECGQSRPCGTSAYVDGQLAARFEHGGAE